MHRWHVRVTPVPNEAEIVTREIALAALTYLKERVNDWRYERCYAFDRTGGYIELYAGGPEEIEATLADYPLRATIILQIDRLVSLDDGFAVLLANIEVAASALPELSVGDGTHDDRDVDQQVDRVGDRGGCPGRGDGEEQHGDHRDGGAGEGEVPGSVGWRSACSTVGGVPMMLTAMASQSAASPCPNSRKNSPNPARPRQILSQLSTAHFTPARVATTATAMGPIERASLRLQDDAGAPAMAMPAEPTIPAAAQMPQVAGGGSVARGSSGLRFQSQVVISSGMIQSTAMALAPMDTASATADGT